MAKIGRKRKADAEKMKNITFSIFPNQLKMVKKLGEIGAITNRSEFFRDAIFDAIKKLDCVVVELNESRNKKIIKIDTTKLKG